MAEEAEVDIGFVEISGGYDASHFGGNAGYQFGAFAFFRRERISGIEGRSIFEFVAEAGEVFLAPGFQDAVREGAIAPNPDYIHIRPYRHFPQFSPLLRVFFPCILPHVSDMDRVPMIQLTRLNHVPLVLNADLIEQIETTPDTVISMTTGQKIRVLESAEEIVERVISFRRQIRDGPETHPAAPTTAG
jgi:flagellar protein FlbD